ncbi:MMPL family transporter [Mycoplasmatota bacterium]|nr:MMPL family transporter [Mycoplasmatota bacterium]
MKKYTNFIFSNKKILFILFMLLNISALIGITQIKLDTNFSSFSPTSSIYQDRLDDLESIFGELNQLVIVTEVNDLTDTVLEDVHAIQSQLSALGSVTYVEGAAPDELLINGTLVPYASLSKEQIINYYAVFEDFSPLKIEGDQYTYVYTLFITDDFTASNITAIEDILDTYSYDSYISGDTYNQLKITDYIIKILLLLPPLALIIIFLVFRWQMGAIKPTLLSVLPAGIGALWTFGIIGWIGNEVSILTAIVPIFIIVIGSADGLHFMSHYQDSIAEGKPTKEALLSTLKLVGIPMIVTTLTSIAGFLSLLTIDTESIKDLSVYSGVGILLAGIATWYVLPLILSTGINISRKNNKEAKFNPAKSLKKLIGLPSLLLVLIIVIVSSLNYGKINNEFNMLMVYKDSTIVA